MVQIQRTGRFVLDLQLPLVLGGDFALLGQRAERTHRGSLQLRKRVEYERFRAGDHHDHFRPWCLCIERKGKAINFVSFKIYLNERMRGSLPTLSTLRDSRCVRPRMLRPLMDRMRSPFLNRPSRSAGELVRILWI